MFNWFLIFTLLLQSIPFPGPGRAPAAAGGGSAPTFENANATNVSFSSGTPSTATATTCTGSNKVMLIGASINTGSDVAVSAASYNSVDMTASLQAAAFVNFNKGLTWLVINPASAATVSITLDTSGAGVIVTACYNGVHQTTPDRTATTGTGTTNPASISVTNSQTNDLIAGLCVLNDTTAANGMTAARVGANQTSRITQTNPTDEAASSISDEAGGGTVTHSWDFVDNGNNGWGCIARPLIPN